MRHFFLSEAVLYVIMAVVAIHLISTTFSNVSSDDSMGAFDKESCVFC